MRFQCFLDGNALCIVRDNFVNLQEDDAVFVTPDVDELIEVEQFMNATQYRVIPDSVMESWNKVKYTREKGFDPEANHDLLLDEGIAIGIELCYPQLKGGA